MFIGADCARWLNKGSQFSAKVALIILEFKKTGGKAEILAEAYVKYTPLVRNLLCRSNMSR